MARLGRPQPVVFDLGANRGQTYGAYRAAFPKATIHCFEPFPEAVGELRSRIGDDASAHVVEAAVAEEPGERTLYVNGMDPTNSLLPRPETARRYYPRGAEQVGEIRVPTITLDGYIAERGVGRVDLLKMDIQGGEVMALRGADALLRSGTVAAVQSEAMFVPHYEGGPLLKDIWAALEPYGYTLYGLYSLRLAKNGQLRFGDARFISEEVRRLVVDAAPEEA